MESATLVADMDEAIAVSRAATAPATRIGDFVALTKPRMNFLVVVTTGVGYFMAARGWNDWSRLFNTLAGTALTAAGEYKNHARPALAHHRPRLTGRAVLTGPCPAPS